jgi:hypothetical protein
MANYRAVGLSVVAVGATIFFAILAALICLAINYNDQRQIRVPDLMIEDTRNSTRVGVAGASRGAQVPWISSSLAEDFRIMQR